MSWAKKKKIQLSERLKKKKKKLPVTFVTMLEAFGAVRALNLFPVADRSKLLLLLFFGAGSFSQSIIKSKQLITCNRREAQQNLGKRQFISHDISCLPSYDIAQILVGYLSWCRISSSQINIYVATESKEV